MKGFVQSALFKALLLAISLVFAVAGCGQGSRVVPDPDAPHYYVYDPAEHGEPDESFAGPGLSVGFCGLDLSRDNLDGIDTLEYWSAVYDSDGALKYVTRVRLRGLLTDCPDIRYDDQSDGYALLVTERGVWVREAGSSKFILDGSDYESWLFEEEIYLSAISRWDGSSDLFTPSSPVSGLLVLLFGIVPGAVLDDSLFEQQGE